MSAVDDAVYDMLVQLISKRLTVKN